MVRNFRKPLVVVAPKILLRLSAAASSLNDMASGTHFLPVIGDTKDPQGVTKVVFVTGKHFYALKDHAKEKSVSDVAFVRVEQLCPFPTKELQDEISKYPNAKSKGVQLKKSFKIIHIYEINQGLCGVKKSIEIWEHGHLFNQDSETWRVSNSNTQGGMNYASLLLVLPQFIM